MNPKWLYQDLTITHTPTGLVVETALEQGPKAIQVPSQAAQTLKELLSHWCLGPFASRSNYEIVSALFVQCRSNTVVLWIRASTYVDPYVLELERAKTLLLFLSEETPS